MRKDSPPLVGPDFSNGGSAIYFLKAVDYPVLKIGKAVDWEERCSLLQCGCPLDLEVILLAPGSWREEAACHSALSGNGIRGEWFKYDELAKQLIDGICRTNGATMTVAQAMIEQHIKSRLDPMLMDRVRSFLLELLVAAQEAGVTDAQLSALSGVPGRAIKSYRVEKKQPSASNGLALFQAFGPAAVEGLRKIITAKSIATVAPLASGRGH